MSLGYKSNALPTEPLTKVSTYNGYGYHKGKFIKVRSPKQSICRKGRSSWDPIPSIIM